MPKIQLPPNLSKLKEVLETGHNLVDHFLVCGMPPQTCLQDFLYDKNNPKYEEIFKENIKPSIISRFPEFDNSIDSVDDEIVNYCFPVGFKPLIANDFFTGKETSFYTLILDNNLFSIEHPQKYLSCLLFYENINSYWDLKQELEKNNKEKNNNNNDILQIDEVEEYEIEQDNNNINNNININNKNDVNNNNIKNNNSNGNNNKDLDRNKLKELISKNIMKSLIVKGKSDEIQINKTSNVNKNYKKLNSSVQIGTTSLRRSNKITEKEIKEIKEANIYIPKVICLVSIHPYIKTFKKILKSIHSYFCDKEIKKEIPLEKLIASLIIEVPIPPRGLYSIHYEFLNNKYIFKGYENNKILVTENNLMHFNSRMNFKTKLEIFKHLIFCSKILFFSTNLNLLSETILSFLVLLYPFKYPFQVTSYVHKDTYGVLECFTPFMFGIHEAFNENFMEENDISTDNMDIFMVDLDNKDKTKLISKENFPKFPSRSTSVLEKEIKNLEHKYKKENMTEEKIEEFNESYQKIFFEFFCDILKGYEDYLNMDYFKVSNQNKMTSTETLLQCPKFIKMHSSSEQPFYEKFLDISQLFGDFIYKRMLPRNNQELIDVLLVNETNIKLKKKNINYFLDSNDYSPVNKYIVPAPRALTADEYELINNKKEQLLSYGQIIKYSEEKIRRRLSTINKNNINKKENNNNNSINISVNNSINIEYNKILFNYILFPQLDFQIYCNADNVNDYYPPPDYTEEIESINSDLLSKSSIGQSINLGLEMKNNLYLTWLEIWSYTFWYFDKEEREFRFDQALDILDAVTHHEINIFNLMFDVLNQQNEPEMIIKLYQKMLFLKINPNTNIYNIISNILDNEQIKQIIDKMKSGDDSSMSLKFNKSYEKKRTRTFLNDDDKPSLINELLKFEAVFPCIDCMEEINLFTLCQNFEGIKNDVLWAPCKKGHYNLPKIKIIFGNEYFPLNATKHPNKSTSIINDIVLHSPYNLKINIKNAMKNKYGTKLDVDKFKSDFCALFWNFIWYCNIYGLDYHILLPYRNKIEQIRTNKIVINHNLNRIKIIYDNKVFHSMEDRIKEINNVNNELMRRESYSFLNNKFQNLEEQRVESIEIHKALKTKYKKALNLFGSYLKKESFKLNNK